MPKDEWGVKRICTQCGERFYDLRKDPMTCPICGAVINLSNLTQDRPKPVEKAVEPKTVKPVAAKDAKDDDSDDNLAVIEDNTGTDADVDVDVDVDDDLLDDDDDDDSVSLDEIADVAADDDD